MTIKIKAPMSYALPYSQCATPNREFESDIPVRIVREADWRKLMRLVRAVESSPAIGDVRAALEALSKEKK